MKKIIQIKESLGFRSLHVLGVKVMTVRKDKAGWCRTHLLGIPVLSVYKSKDGHHRVYFCGIRVFNRQPSPQDMISKLQARVKILETNLDITNLPPARGWLRDMQLGNLILLREADRICRLFNINYWLDCGTLLGAVRHGGFIPWDDDIDISMLRHDVKRFIECFEQNCSGGFYLDFFCEKFYSGIKVCHRDLPRCWVDVFSYDFYHRQLDSIGERCELTDYVRWAQRRFPMTSDWKAKTTFCNNWRDEVLLKGKKVDIDCHPDIFWGVEFMAVYVNSIFFPYKTILPTGKLMFEGYEFSVPHDTNAYLTYMYGDYMNYPSALYGSHVPDVPMSLDGRIQLHDFIQNHVNE